MAHPILQKMCHFDWPRQKGILSVASPSSLPGWEKSKEVQLMKKTFRRALSLTIASGLTLAMAVTAGAAEGDTLTRGEMAKLLVEGAGLTGQVEQYQAQESVFQDVPEDSEYKGYINLAYAQGLISGTGADTFSPDAQTTQVEAAAAIMQYAGVPEEMLTSWPADYSTTAARVGLTEGITYSADAAVTEGQFQTMLENGSSLVGKPYIGITWKANDQDYAGFKAVIEAAGGNPVELYQVTSTAVGYGADGMIQSAYVADTGNLLQEYADQIKARNYSATNVAEVMEGIDGVFFTGGEDISPSLFAVPQEEANGGEEINATRDISDYTLMAYCIDNDVPTFAACRGMQMMSIVSAPILSRRSPTITPNRARSTTTCTGCLPTLRIGTMPAMMWSSSAPIPCCTASWAPALWPTSPPGIIRPSAAWRAPT